MNNIELQANLVRDTNLSKLYEVCEDQQSISTSRLEKMLDEVLEQQKKMGEEHSER